MTKPEVNQISSDVAEWRMAYKFLPKEFRDFHDQKDLFKAVHARVDVKANEYIKDLSFMQGQMYVIDIFLWFMARHGYTLQKSRAKLNFNSLDDTLKYCEDERIEEMRKMFAALEAK